MREILFRAKQNYGNIGKWVVGLVAQPHVTENGIVTSYYFTELKENGISSQKTVSADTIGQYTGLTDKKGKKIFEGDIVNISLLGGVEVGQITYSEISFRFKFADKYGSTYGFDDTCIFEVIGNIHDNPELLKGGAE